MTIYIVGIYDTRGEKDVKGYVTTELKARKWVTLEKEKRKGWNSRQWPSYELVRKL